MSKTQTKKSGPRFNIFDVLIILAVIACIAAIVLHAYFIKDINENFVLAKVEFTISDISQNTASSFCNVHRKIYLQNGDDEIGTITEATYSPQKMMVEDAEGKLVEVQHPSKKQVTGTASIKGLWTEDGFMINGTILATVGSTVNIYTQDAACTITVVSVSKIQ